MQDMNGTSAKNFPDMRYKTLNALVTINAIISEINPKIMLTHMFNSMLVKLNMRLTYVTIIFTVEGQEKTLYSDKTLVTMTKTCTYTFFSD